MFTEKLLRLLGSEGEMSSKKGERGAGLPTYGRYDKATAVAVARKRLRTIDGATPAMAGVRDLLAPARDLAEKSQQRADALLILARAAGATWSELGGALGTTRQGALARHDRVARKLEKRGS